MRINLIWYDKRLSLQDISMMLSSITENIEHAVVENKDLILIDFGDKKRVTVKRNKKSITLYFWIGKEVQGDE